MKQIAKQISINQILVITMVLVS